MHIILFLCFNIFFYGTHSASKEWTWVSGNNSIDVIGNYGLKGESSINNYPGSRERSISWIDSSNKTIWLFGGSGYSESSSIGYLNDLWSFSIESNEWTWISGNNTKDANGNYGIKGESSINNYPGGRDGSISWIDSSNKTIWLIGGNGYAESSNGRMNDVWSFSIESNEWTWISGNNTVDVNGNYGTKGISSINNYPGSRSTSISWFDSSNKTIWLFGGFGYFESSNGWLNDLWSYSIESNEWTWISGNNSIDVVGNYGIKGESSINNYPGSRSSSISWFDSSNKTIWLFGGYGYSESSSGRMNDLWSYSIELNEWTWVSGNNTYNVKGNYGIKGESSINNYPGSRHGSISWFDSSNKMLWLFGGYGYSESTFGYFNDLWSYSIESNEWTWVSGNNTINVNGNYGIKGESSINNYPGSRYSSISWIDSSNKTIWLFGGSGYFESSNVYLNDLWSFKLRDDVPNSEPELEPEEVQEEPEIKPEDNTSGYYNIRYRIFIELAVIILYLIIH